MKSILLLFTGLFLAGIARAEINGDKISIQMVVSASNKFDPSQTGFNKGVASFISSPNFFATYNPANLSIKDMTATNGMLYGYFCNYTGEANGICGNAKGKSYSDTVLNTAFYPGSVVKVSGFLNRFAFGVPFFVADEVEVISSFVSPLVGTYLMNLPENYTGASGSRLYDNATIVIRPNGTCQMQRTASYMKPAGSAVSTTVNYGMGSLGNVAYDPSYRRLDTTIKTVEDECSISPPQAPGQAMEMKVTTYLGTIPCDGTMGCVSTHYAGVWRTTLALVYKVGTSLAITNKYSWDTVSGRTGYIPNIGLTYLGIRDAYAKITAVSPALSLFNDSTRDYNYPVVLSLNNPIPFNLPDTVFVRY